MVDSGLLDRMESLSHIAFSQPRSVPFTVFTENTVGPALCVSELDDEDGGNGS